MKYLFIVFIFLISCTTNTNISKKVTAEYITTKDNHRIFKTTESDFLYVSINDLPSEPRYKGIFFLEVQCNKYSVCQLISISDIAGYQYP